MGQVPDRSNSVKRKEKERERKRKKERKGEKDGKRREGYSKETGV
jgi:hypothetical protein